MFGDFLRNNRLIKETDYRLIENGTVVVARKPNIFPKFQFGIFYNGNVILQLFLMRENRSVFISVPFEDFRGNTLGYEIYEYTPKIFVYDKRECIETAKNFVGKYFIGYSSVLGDDFTFLCMVGSKFDSFFNGSRVGRHYEYKYIENNGVILKHHFISIEQDWVIHFSEGRNHADTRLRLEDYYEVINRTIFDVDEVKCKKHDSLTDLLTSRNRALFEWASMNDFNGYNILTNNCEHFANYCRIGKRKSNQVITVACDIALTVISCLAMKKPIPLLLMKQRYIDGYL